MSIQAVRGRSMSPSLTKSMALNLAEWHASSVQHFGVASYYTDCLWWRQPGGSGIYLAALIHDGQRSDAQVHEEVGVVMEKWEGQRVGLYDCWGHYNLAQIGLARGFQNPWYWRAPAAPPALDLPEGLTIEIAETPQQLADFERASWEGFEEPENPEEEFQGRQRFSQHPAQTLGDPDMYYLNARLEGEVVAGAIIQASEGVNGEGVMGIYGISTLPRFRRRGYASALVRAAAGLRPHLPMCVFPDPESLPIYTALNFEAAGEIAFWGSPES